MLSHQTGTQPAHDDSYSSNLSDSTLVDYGLGNLSKSKANMSIASLSFQVKVSISKKSLDIEL